MKILKAILLLLFLINADFLLAQDQETQSQSSLKSDDNASVNVIWEGNTSVFIVIDGTIYTFRGGQSQVLTFRPNVLLEFYIQVPGTKYSSKGIVFEPTGGELKVELKNGNLIYDLKSQEELSSIETRANDVKENFLQIIEASMVHVEGGNFTMGCTPEQGGDCISDENPKHQVTLSSYSIGKYEVTQELWQAVMGNNPSRLSGCDHCPVHDVKWNDVQVFISKINSLSGKNYRLPTEAEWEFASRGGNLSKGFKFSGSNAIDEVAWYKGMSSEQPNPVGHKSPNELGIYDMSGNVWEWCEDWYGGYGSLAQTDPKGPNSGRMRTMRGGSWFNPPGNVRVSSRGGLLPENGSHILGFRLAL